MFNEEQLELVLENARLMNKHSRFYKGFAGTYWEPPEPASLEISFDIVLENISSHLTAEELERYQELEKDETVISYVETYARELTSLPEELENHFIEYDETYHTIAVKREYNRLIISVEMTI
ncbi:MAG: hypothetical protein ACJ71H_04985 [Nitrososphaeraceae archaeon]